MTHVTNMMNGTSSTTADTDRRSSPLRVLAASACTQGQCPTVYESSPGTIVVQGYVVSAATAGIDVPEGEMLVEIPSRLLIEAVEKMA